MVAAHQAAAVAVAAHADVKVSNLPLFTAPESVVKRFSIDGFGIGGDGVGIRVVKPNLKKQSNKKHNHQSDLTTEREVITVCNYEIFI